MAEATWEPPAVIPPEEVRSLTEQVLALPDIPRSLAARGLTSLRFERLEPFELLERIH
jgi:hypothetical protein